METHLLRDIAARSENFFQAAGVVQDLRGVLARTYLQVKSLRKEVRPLLFMVHVFIYKAPDTSVSSPAGSGSSRSFDGQQMQQSATPVDGQQWQIKHCLQTCHLGLELWRPCLL